VDSLERSLTYRLDLEYDGTDFAGWQFQAGQRTVQGCLEDAVSRLFAAHSRISSAGRTDAGVHATGQVASFQSALERPADSLHRALNNHLPPDIRVHQARLMPADFHARFSARWRGYEYSIAKHPLAVGRHYAWHYSVELDVAAMQQAAAVLIGSHDFRAYAHFNPAERHYLSDVYYTEWSENIDYYKFTIRANRFLHGMVRLLVGTFVKVGRGKIAPAAVLDILSSKDNRNSGQKVPSSGLVLCEVGYFDWPAK
jgi:tRNA pseudouridine38-40 synthase